MAPPVTNEELMAYLDGELPAGERQHVEAALARSTELQRELAIYRAMRRDLGALALEAEHAGSVWDAVDRRITRPVGWILFTAGAVLWLVYSAWVFAVSPASPWEKIALGAFAAGFLILLARTIFERMREVRSDPYRDIER